MSLPYPRITTQVSSVQRKMQDSTPLICVMISIIE